MILKEYFNTLDKQAVLGAILGLYPDSDYDSYSFAWDEIVTLEPKADPETADMIICVKHVYYEYEYDAQFGDMEPDDYISVCGERPSAYDDGTNSFHGVRQGRDITWAIEHTPWTEWLAWEVENLAAADLRCKDDYQLLAHILYEMTFCAYSNEEVGCEMAIIKERMDEIEKWEAEGTLDDHLIPLDIDKLIAEIAEMDDNED